MSDSAGRSFQVGVLSARCARHAMRCFSVVVCLSIGSAELARAEEPSGCAAFKWSLKREAELLQFANKPAIASGSAATVDGKAYDLKLAALPEAHLPQPPGRMPKTDPSMAAFLRYGAPAAAVTVQITSSAAVWIDVIQNGKAVKSSAFSGARDCPGVRNTLRYPHHASPFVVQISFTNDRSIGIIRATELNQRAGSRWA